MTKPLQLITGLALLFAGCSLLAADSLSFDVPAGWNREHKQLGDFYSVTAKAPNGGLLMFSPWPPPAKPEDIPALVRKLAEGFAQQARTATNFTLSSYKYQITEFAGTNCNGSYATFKSTTSSGSELLQVMFMMSIGGQVWNGQFTGPTDAWEQSLAMLRSIKKND